MRILIVTPEYRPHQGGGILKYYGELAPALAKRGCDVAVLVAAPTSPDFEDYEADGTRIVCVKRADVDACADRLAQFSAAPEFRRWLAGALTAAEAARRLGPWDVIEATDFGLGFVPFVLDPTGPPVVVQLHGSLGQIADHEPVQADRLLDSVLARLAEAMLLPCASELQTSATGNSREWEARTGRLVSVMPPPLRLSPSAEAADGSALVVGRIQTWKGPAVLCEALRRLPDAFPPVQWVGRDTPTASDGGSLSSELASRYPDVWGRRVVPLGQRPFDDLHHLMATARMVIVPSEWDVFNLAAAEAMAAGRVVVCSSGAGASDVITHGQNGFVFEAGDAESLASALAAAEGMATHERTRMGAAAREAVVSRLDPDIVAAERLNRYRAIAAKGSADRALVPDWVRDAFAARASGRVGLEFLDQMNVRDLSKYLGQRLRDGLVNRLGGSAT